MLTTQADICRQALDALLARQRALDFNWFSINSTPSTPTIGFIRRHLPLGGVMVRQFYRLLPFNARGKFVAGEQPDNPKSLLLFLIGLLEIDDDQARSDRLRLEKRLLALRSSKARNFAIRQNKRLDLLSYGADADDISPLLTMLAGRYFLRAWQHTGDGGCADLARCVIRYFLEEHPRKEFGPDGVYFYYEPHSPLVIYNASAQISAFLLAGGSALDLPEAVAAGKRGMDFVISRQNPDGSWHYGESKWCRYIDNFHTAMLLDALATASAYSAEAASSFASGLAFYRRTLVPGGRPRHFAWRRPPLNSSLFLRLDLRDLLLTATVFLLHSERMPELADDAGRLLAKAVKSMFRKDRFYPEITWLWKNRIPYVEFQAWGVAALAMYIHHTDTGAVND